MPPAPRPDDDRVRFLITCIKNMKGDTIDFQKVAYTLELVSANAAKLRYRRMLEANKESSNDQGSKEPTPKKAKAVEKDKAESKPKRRVSKSPSRPQDAGNKKMKEETADDAF